MTLACAPCTRVLPREPFFISSLAPLASSTVAVRIRYCESACLITFSECTCTYSCAQRPLVRQALRQSAQSGPVRQHPRLLPRLHLPASVRSRCLSSPLALSTALFTPSVAASRCLPPLVPRTLQVLPVPRAPACCVCGCALL